jgi:hypothetical protein
MAETHDPSVGAARRLPFAGAVLYHRTTLFDFREAVVRLCSSVGLIVAALNALKDRTLGVEDVDRMSKDASGVGWAHPLLGTDGRRWNGRA